MEKIVYMPWIAAELRKQGFQILRVEVNPRKPQYDCYVFEDSEAFRQAFTAITSA